ncbi:MAG TPA: VWA domain-containing protein [Bryobacteraceae bacterium]|nr:VWA domain-containing protein [Bryobacteraceae bacterium]
MSDLSFKTASLVQFVALVGSALLLCGQGPAPTNPSFSVSVNLVQVDAVVTDSNGHAVRDLQKDDFEILEDRKPETITNFSRVEVAPPPTPPSAPSSGGGASRPAGAPPARITQKNDIRRDIVLMFDDASINEVDLTPILSDMHRFVSNQIQPGDEIAVTASRGGMGFYERFTNDKRQMHAAIDHIARRPGYGLWNLEPPTHPNGKGEEVPLETSTSIPGEPPQGYRSDSNAPNPVGHLMWAIQGLQNMPGRKAVVLFSKAFGAPPALVNLANRAGVVIYMIDPTGVPPFVCCVNTGQVYIVPEDYRLLAKETGGLWTRDVPGKELTEDLGRVLDDMSGYYLIGYQPDRSDFDPVKGRAVHHDIQVKVRRPGLTVRARNGFLGTPDSAAPAKPQPRTTHEYLQEALASPFAAGSIRLRVDPLYEATPPDSKTKRRGAVLRAMLQVEGRDLKFVPGSDGKEKLTYSLLVAVFRQDGSPVRSGEHTYTVDVTPEEEARLKVSGFHFSSSDVPLPMAGSYQIRAAVRDENSGDLGSAYSFLDVPDFNKPQLALSSIELSAAKSSSNGNLSSWTQYATGATLEFQCDVFGIRNASQLPREPHVEMEVRLFRDGAKEPVFDSKTLPVPAKTLAKNYLYGGMRIGKEIEPGDYMMQLTVYDRLAPQKKQAATQWANLTVVTPTTP